VVSDGFSGRLYIVACCSLGIFRPSIIDVIFGDWVEMSARPKRDW
jgi:hypothetical protein